MTYLGNAPGAQGFMFMYSPNNILFFAMQCIFDELLFPKCPKLAWQTTQLQECAPHTKENIPMDEELGSLYLVTSVSR